MGLDNPLHIAFLLVILLLVFGAKRLPEMGRSLGEGLRGFKDAIGGEGGLTHFGESTHSAGQSTHVAPGVAQTQAAQPQPHTAQPQPAVIAPAPGMPVVVAHASSETDPTDPQLVAAARTLGAQKATAAENRSQ